ncbi:MAG: NAD(P)H-dependent oxidoreductase [Victivallales bacterium]|jgi:FMN-dependent NADH-azoreductase
MKKLLHIIATPRGEESRTLKVTNVFLDTFKEKHADWVLDELDLGKEELPSLTVKRVDGKYVLLGGKDLYGDMKESWQDIISHIERFISADAYLISTPMWNFSIPYTLKQYIIVQPKYLFRYTANGVEGLVKNKKMVVVSSRGGEYVSEDTRGADFQEPYLRFVFGFVGITDVTFVKAEPMDMGEETQKQRIRDAQKTARKVAAQL